MIVSRTLYAIPEGGEAFRPLADHAGHETYDTRTTVEQAKIYESDPFLLARDLLDLSKYPKHQFEVRKANDPAWREREAARFADGVYKALPNEWNALKLPADHFCHVANGSEDCIAYTESDEKGQRDIQTRLKAGKYVKKFFPDLGNEAVRTYAESIMSLVDVQMTDDPEIAAQIYENGPHSCMKKNQWLWQSMKKTIDPMPRHPVAACFNGDLKLAWLGTVEAPTARVLVWPEKKLYGYPYGAHERLTMALRRQGYKAMAESNTNPNFDGARLRLIRVDESRIVLPSIDYIRHVEYIHETDAIYIGNHHSKEQKSLLFRPQFTQNGTEAFTIPPSKSVDVKKPAEAG